MKLIKYTTEKELDQSDVDKLQAYKENVSNVNAERFASKIEHEGNWYMSYAEDFKEYYSEDEISRVEEINIEETEQ